VIAPVPDADSLRRRVRGALAARTRRELAPDDRVPAAVLVLFVYRSGEPHLVFTQKSEAVPHHKGQYSFPGGIVEASDPSRVDTALREAREEIALDPAAVEVLGVLDDTPTATTKFVITPVVGLCRGTPVFRADGREIQRLVEVPLSRLLDPACYREELWEREGAVRPISFFTCADSVIWGATARILKDFLDLVFRP
jgi:8-oxo-dGTP pyrophosphatase MutT (NUDIX family)